jgi:dTDP-4-amino-4,6-dideoxygalactose transaminase
MVTTNDQNLARLSDIMRNHGAEISEEMRHNSSKPYLLPDFKMLGFNYRMTDLQAAVGLVQLKKLQAKWLKLQLLKTLAIYCQKLAER